MTTRSWLAVGLVLLAALLLLWWEKPTDYPYRAIGAYRGDQVSLFTQTDGGANLYSTFESPVGTDYQVPSGKTFVVTHVVFESSNAANLFVIGYGDDAVQNSAAAPTNAVSVLGKHGTTPHSALVGATASTLYAVDVYAEIPAEKYLFLQASTTAGAIQLFGVER